MIVGPSGCGKTTLLNAIAGFHSITSGEIVLDGKLLCGTGKPLAAQGADRIVVFQNGALFPWKTLAENVAYGPMVQRVLSKRDALEKAHEMLAEAGLGEFGGKYPGEVSSGMARRAEIVRALINNPSILLADEPTGNLDTKTSIEVMGIFQRLNQERGITVVLITHEMDIAEYGTRMVTFRDGQVVADKAIARRRHAADELAALPEPAEAV